MSQVSESAEVEADEKLLSAKNAKIVNGNTKKPESKSKFPLFAVEI